MTAKIPQKINRMVGRQLHHNTTRSLCALISGTLITLSLAPFSFWPLAIIACGILFVVLQQQSIKQSFWLGWCFGLGLFGTGASWVYVSIHEFGYTSIYLAALLTFLFCGGLAFCCAIIWALYAWLLKKHNVIVSNSHSMRFAMQTVSTQHLILFAAVWVCGEWMRSWLLTGFPWLFIGYSQTESLLAGWAPIVGVYGISFIICLSGATLSYLLLSHKNYYGSRSLLTAVALCWFIAIPLKHVPWTVPAEDNDENKKPRQVSMVQANISQHDKWRREFRQPTLALYKNLSEPHWQTSELVIWPEAAIPMYYQYANDFLDQMAAQATKYQSALLTGIPSRDTYSDLDSSSDNRYNSIITIGNANGVYHKQNLVPFGEYIPFANLLGNVLAFFELPASTMHAGNADQTPLTIQQWQSKPLICYEIVYPSLAAKAAAVSDVLITVSNDSWFGGSIGPLQHLQMAQMRALENGRYVLRSTGSGVSAIINPAGQILARSEQFEQTVLTGEFKLMQQNTPWTVFGYWLTPLLCCAPLIFQIYSKFNKLR